MTDADPTMVRPRDTLARAIYEGRNGAGCTPWARQQASHKAPYLLDATAVLNRLHELGAFNDQFYDAIKKEAGK